MCFIHLENTSTHEKERKRGKPSSDSLCNLYVLSALVCNLCTVLSRLVKSLTQGHYLCNDLNQDKPRCTVSGCQRAHARQGKKIGIGMHRLFLQQWGIPVITWIKRQKNADIYASSRKYNLLCQSRQKLTRSYDNSISGTTLEVTIYCCLVIVLEPFSVIATFILQAMLPHSH